jgi:beta-glucosidase-like glycosyl hydrolase
VILSDDLEMKAIAATYSVPDAAVQAIAAGCDGLLICSGDVEVQALTLEALVHAVEDGRIPFTRIEDALKRLRVAKERSSGNRCRPDRRQPCCGRCWLRGAPARRRRHGARRVMMKPRPLRPGDRIAVVAPASPSTRDELERGESRAAALGFEPVHSEASSNGSCFRPDSPTRAPPTSCARGPTRRSPR